MNIQFEPSAPNYGLDRNAVKEVASVLWALAADQAILGENSFNFHSNVLGARAKQLRKLFESQGKECMKNTKKTSKLIRNVS